MLTLKDANFHSMYVDGTGRPMATTTHIFFWNDAGIRLIDRF